jgi:predicted TIM-barrel fold metal-dependent hydrolase
MEKAVEEIAWGKKHGACGVFKRGIEVGRSAKDPYFFPLYQRAAELDMPICIHTGAHDPVISDALSSHLTMYNFNLSPIDAFVSMVTGGIPAMFPKLRVGFIETMASWIPYAMADLEARHQRTAWIGSFDYSRELMKDGRFYVACQTHEDLAYILQHTGPDQMLIGSDYSHADQSAELEALSLLRDRVDIDATITKKIVSDNPSRFYSID